MIMHKWMLTWNLQKLFSGLYLHAIFLLGCLHVVLSDCTPEQLAAIMNCSRHERHTRNYDYMEGGDVRIRQLFSRTQWFLTIGDNGSINGTQDPANCHSKAKKKGINKRNKFIGSILPFKSYKKKINLTTVSKIPAAVQPRAVALPGDRSVWEVLLYRVYIVITMLMGHASPRLQPR